MAGEYTGKDSGGEEQEWDGGTGMAEGGGEQEVMRKLRKITFIQRGEDDEAEVEQVRMELDRECSRGRLVGQGSSEEELAEEDVAEEAEGGDADGGARWESFLPQRHLRVLLAEDDDSTRHVVGALLRNCSYEVTPASNGLHAWELLESGHHQFDLVLTDVVMPGLSGISLLSKIMAEESHKRVPVIMMSSHDSMDMVLKCFQKGASDFLVKPVRKNELKNLWQHVWRKCNSSSGSGSGSGSQTEKVNRPKSHVGSGNASGNGSADGGRSGSGSGSTSNAQGGSDNGSGTQMDAPPLQKSDKRPKCRNDEATAGDSKEHKHDVALGKGLEMGPPRSRAAGNPTEEEEQEDGTPEGPSLSPSPLDRPLSDDGEAMETGDTSTPEIEASPPPVEAIDLLGNVGSHHVNLGRGSGEGGVKEVKEEEESERGAEAREVLMDRGGSNSPNAETETLPTLELTLKRPREEEGDVEDRKVLRQSGGSAFSRYSTSGLAAALQQQQQHLPVPHGGYSIAAPFSKSPISPRHGFERTNGTAATNEITTPVPVNPRHVAHNATDLSTPSGMPDSFSSQRTLQEEGGERSGNMRSPQQGVAMGMRGPRGVLFERATPTYGNYGGPFYGAAWGGHRGELEGYERAGGGGYGESGFSESPRVARPHPHHHHHQQHHHQSQHHQAMHHQSQGGAGTPLQQQNGIGSSVEGGVVSNMEAAAVPDSGVKGSGSHGSLHGSNGNQGSGGSGIGGVGNGSIVNASSGNGSASGSNNGSNGHKGNGNSNGQSGQMPTAMAVDGEGGEAGNNGSSGVDNGMSKGGTGGGSGNGVVVVGPTQNRSARREAALNKFRQKRKERCFEKKVRYQSRKRLAEQRPRVRGQFVRQTALVNVDAE